MATLAQLDAEPYWDREIVTAELAALGADLRRRTGRPADAFGSKGNTSHLNGGHRSQEWIQHSVFCTNHTYTVQSSLTAEQLRHIAACDWTPDEWGTAANRTLMVGITRRLLAAMRAGELSGVREVIGTLDGKTVHAERYNGDRFSADSSHLDHVHVTFDRRRMHDAALMARVADLIIGDDDMLKDETIPLPKYAGNTQPDANAATAVAYTLVRTAATYEAAKRIEAGQAAILAEIRAQAEAERVQRGIEQAALVNDVVHALSPLFGQSGVTVEMLEEAFRRALGSLDGATPAAQ